MNRTPENKGRRLGGRAAFFTKMAAIRQALDAGIHLNAIYEQHAAYLRIGYSQFCKHVRRYITLKDRKPEAKWKSIGASGMDGSPRLESTTASEPRSAGQKDLPVFHYDPVDAYRDRK
jgi:hypothetical protein